MGDLKEVSIPEGCGLYQDKLGSLYILDKEAVAASKGLKPVGYWAWKQN